MAPRQSRPDPTEAVTWMEKARNELAFAKGFDQLPHVELASFAFHAQQAVEFALKAVYHHHNLPFDFVHDIRILAQNLSDGGIQVPQDVHNAVPLTRFYTATRYPNPASARVTKSELEAAIQLAEKVVNWADQIV